MESTFNGAKARLNRIKPAECPDFCPAAFGLPCLEWGHRGVGQSASNCASPSPFGTSRPKLAHYSDASSKHPPYAFQWKVQENMQFPVRASASDRINPNAGKNESETSCN
jgi:hypothetical protein